MVCVTISCKTGITVVALGSVFVRHVNYTQQKKISMYTIGIFLSNFVHKFV